jgi:hypothetical protein
VYGDACLGAHQGSEAAAEFQKILDHRGHRGIVFNEPIGPLAHLGLARAHHLWIGHPARWPSPGF